MSKKTPQTASSDQLDHEPEVQEPQVLETEITPQQLTRIAMHSGTFPPAAEIERIQAVRPDILDQLIEQNKAEIAFNQANQEHMHQYSPKFKWAEIIVESFSRIVGFCFLAMCILAAYNAAIETQDWRIVSAFLAPPVLTAAIKIIKKI